MNPIVHLRRSSARRPQLRWSASRLVKGLRSMWQRILANLATYFPPDEPQPSPPLCRRAVEQTRCLMAQR
jgi:hypothetical protein